MYFFLVKCWCSVKVHQGFLRTSELMRNALCLCIQMFDHSNKWWTNKYSSAPEFWELSKWGWKLTLMQFLYHSFFYKKQPKYVKVWFFFLVLVKTTFFQILVEFVRANIKITFEYTKVFSVTSASRYRKSMKTREFTLNGTKIICSRSDTIWNLLLTPHHTWAALSICSFLAGSLKHFASMYFPYPQTFD